MNSVIHQQVTAAQLRAFHLTGAGLDEFTPSAPLRPELFTNTSLDPAPANGFRDLRDLYAKALRDQRGKACARFIENIRYCRDRVQELLMLDDSRDPALAGSPGAVSASLGHGVAFFDSDALAGALQSVPSNSTQRMSLTRRRRCEDTLATLSTALEDAANQPLYWEFPSADEGAISFCKRQLEIHVDTLKALRVARLEMESAYEPDIHDETLERFDWESADAEELAAMPPVLVVDSAQIVAEKSLTCFGRLLRSGLPIQILITCPPFYTGELAFLSLSHREAFVMQSSAACPSHLSEALTDMAHTLRPAVAVVSIADAPMFHESRTFPLYVYDPEAGEDWVQRFRLHPAQFSSPAVNAVHAAAITPAMARHFRVLPPEACNDEQLDLKDYLAQWGTRPPLSVPFISVLDETGEPQRAAVTRELILIARDRIKAWRLLEQLAEAGKAPIDTVQIQHDATKAALLRVVEMLTGGGPVVAPAAAPPLGATPPPTSTTAPPEPPLTITEPFIDSALCTSCNDCMKVNSRMFQYNGNKQAFIGDATAGTFAELVKAAEGCPARCIHPGSPRADDRTATPKLIARAAKYN